MASTNSRGWLQTPVTRQVLSRPNLDKLLTQASEAHPYWSPAPDVVSSEAFQEMDASRPMGNSEIAQRVRFFNKRILQRISVYIERVLKKDREYFTNVIMAPAPRLGSLDLAAVHLEPHQRQAWHLRRGLKRNPGIGELRPAYQEQGRHHHLEVNRFDSGVPFQINRLFRS